MRSGQMDSTVIIQRATTVRDDYGTPIDTWADVVTLRAQVIQSSTEEFIRGAGAQDQTVTVFRTHFYDDITNADRIVCDGTLHDIKELKELGRRQALEIRTVSSGEEA